MSASVSVCQPFVAGGGSGLSSPQDIFRLFGVLGLMG